MIKIAFEREFSVNVNARSMSFHVTVGYFMIFATFKLYVKTILGILEVQNHIYRL